MLMHPRTRSFAAWMAARVPTILILALLGGLAVWGARNHWRFPQLRDDGARADKHAGTEKVKVIRGSDGGGGSDSASQATRSARTEFPSAEAVRAAGIDCVTVKTRDMSQFVTANSMLDYEPYRYAQLAARAPGTVWWVEKQMGEPVRKGEVLALIDSTDVGRAKADF